MAMMLAAALSGCHGPRPAPPVPSPHYVLGGAYQAGGQWYYPTETDNLDITGLATVAGPADGLTADGELRDPTALTAAMQTVPLPAIARVTNLETGRQLLVRVNDRGPADPARLIAVSPRAAGLLGMAPGGVAQVRVTLEPVLTQRAIDGVAGAPHLAVSAAPEDTVAAEPLAPPGAPAAPRRTATLRGGPAPAVAAPLPLRLPEQVFLLPPRPGLLYLDAGSFGRFEYANVRAAQLARLGADVVASREGRVQSFRVRAGPFRGVAEADAAMATARRAGIGDARLVIE